MCEHQKISSTILNSKIFKDRKIGVDSKSLSKSLVYAGKYLKTVAVSKMKVIVILLVCGLQPSIQRHFHNH